MGSYGRYPSAYAALDSSTTKLLERYCFLTRIGEFAAAESLWTTDLSHRPLNFIYLVTRVEAILRQTRYGDASDYLSHHLASTNIREGLKLTDGQLKLLSLLHAYCEIFTLGRLRKAVGEARRAWSWLSKYKHTEYDEVQTYIVEIYLHTMKYAQGCSTFTTPEDLTFPPGNKTDTPLIWAGFETWLTHLQHRGWFWEALTVLKILGPPQTIEWGSTQYQSLIEAIKDTSSRESGSLCRFASIVSYSRLLSSKGKTDDGLNFANQAAAALTELQTTRESTPRQTLELEIALLEATESALEAPMKLKKWNELASLAESSQEHGIQSTCLSRYGQTAAASRLYEEIDRHQAKLEEVEKNVERDMPTVLISHCGLWRAGDQNSWALLLEWFQNFDNQFPTSAFLLGGTESEDDLMTWDVPLGKFREEQLKYVMFSALRHPELARKALSASTMILKHVPLNIVTEWGLKDRWLLEWQDPLAPTPLGAVDVLAKRIYLSYADAKPQEQQNDWRRYKDLNATELNSILFSWPFDSNKFAERLSSLQAWFSGDNVLFDSEASGLLIAQLMLAQMAHAKDTTQPPPVIASQTRQFVDFVESLPESSLKQYLIRNALLARQQLLDTELIFSPSLNADSLRHLRQECQGLIQRYENTYLAGEFAKIGGLYARLGEITLRLRESPGSLEDSKALYEKGFGYFDHLRSEISALGGTVALEIKMAIRQGLTGDQQLLSRGLSLLIAAYSTTGIDHQSRSQIAFMVWDFVQRSKNRALNDILSSASPISASDGESIRGDPHASSLIEGWQRLLQALSNAKSSKSVDATAVVLARKNLEAHEKLMQVDPQCVKVLALSKGQSATALELKELFKKTPTGVLLVDWFVADIVGQVRDKLYMIILRVAPALEPPQVCELELGIAHKVQAWIANFLQGPDSDGNRRKAVSYQELKKLAGLVQPLAAASRPGDFMVFCPTTTWNLHRVPLHAIELRDEARPVDVPPRVLPTREGQDGRTDGRNGVAGNQREVPVKESHESTQKDEKLLMLRNKVFYTYSHSLLRLSIISRETDPNAYSTGWRATVLSPLALGNNAALAKDPLVQGGNSEAPSVSRQREIRDKTKSMSAFLQSSYLAHQQVSATAVIRATKDSDFVFFQGHVHLAAKPLSSHLFLYHPDSNEPCSATGDHEAETFLSGEKIISECRLRQGAHVVMLACGSGVTEARVPDEALGLVPAFFHAGARSVVGSLWDIKIIDACQWITKVQGAWAEREWLLRRNKSAVETMIDLGDCFRAAAKSMLDSVGRENLSIDSWAGFVYHGYWMFPRAPCVVDD